MAREATVPWAQNLGMNLDGVSYNTVPVRAETREGEVIATEAESVTFASLSAAEVFFGGAQNLLDYIQDSVNSWFRNRALAKARGMSESAALQSAITGLVRAFVKRHGRDPNDDELARIRAKAQALIGDI